MKKSYHVMNIIFIFEFYELDKMNLQFYWCNAVLCADIVYDRNIFYWSNSIVLLLLSTHNRIGITVEILSSYQKISKEIANTIKVFWYWEWW